MTGWSSIAFSITLVPLAVALVSVTISLVAIAISLIAIAIAIALVVLIVVPLLESIPFRLAVRCIDLGLSDKLGPFVGVDSPALTVDFGSVDVLDGHQSL